MTSQRSIRKLECGGVRNYVGHYHIFIPQRRTQKIRVALAVRSASGTSAALQGFCDGGETGTPIMVRSD